MELPGLQGATPQGQPSIEFITDPGRISDTNVRQVLELRQAAHVDGRAPDKSFLDPLRLRFLLGSLSLLEVEPEPLRFRYRLVGTDIVQRLGHELTGKFMDQHPDAMLRPFLIKGATMVHHAAMPIYAMSKRVRWARTGCWKWWPCRCSAWMVKSPSLAPARVFRPARQSHPAAPDRH